MAEGRLKYQPGLDGLRALGLFAMLAFHDDRLKGGFLGLSTFFTLSGFLITGLLLSEYGQSGRISLKAFYARRARRLLPAAFLGLLLAAVVTASIHDGQASLNFRWDALSAVGEVTNWRMIWSGRAYANLLITPSPLLHYWSLAVEEQFYLVLAPLVVLCMVLTKGRKRLLGLALGALAMASFVDGFFVVRQGIDRAYYGTDSRALEFLIGALLAVFMSERVLTRRQSRVVTIVGPLLLLSIITSAFFASVTDPNLFHGIFLVNALANAVVVLAACEPGLVRTFCSFKPLQSIGQVSYGVYIYHWPIFIWMSHARTGLGPLALTAARLSATFAVAVLSYVYVEQPIRYRRKITGGAPWIAIPGAAAMVTAAALLVGAVAPPLAATFSPEVSQASVLKDARRQLASSDTAPVAAHTKAHELKRLMIVGDSVALTLGRGIERWGAKRGITVLNYGIIGCPLLTDVTVRGYWGVSDRTDPCKTHELWPKVLAEFKPDLIIAVYGGWDVYDVSLDHGKTWISPGDKTFDDLYTTKVESAADRLRSTGSRLLWLPPPCFGPRPDATEAEASGVWWDPARVEVVRKIDHEVAAKNGMEISDSIHDSGCPVNRKERPDGTHYIDSGADAALEFLGPIIEQAAR